MFNKRFFSIIAVLLVMAVLFCACSQRASGKPNGSVAVTFAADVPLQLTHSVLVMPLDGTMGMLRIHGNNASQDLQWVSSDPSVVTVKDGMFSAVAPGTAQITCADGANTAVCTVTVTEATMGDYTLRLPQNALSMKTGDVVEAECTYNGPGAVAMHSSDTRVVVVENGACRAVAPGRACITYTDGLRHAQCMVEVE